jgi:solute carrier family 25 citrate transporter 1
MCSEGSISYCLCIRFGAFETFKKFTVDDKGNLRPVDRMLCGLGAGVCEAIFAVTPMETVKVKFINDRRSANPRFRGFFHGCSIIVKDEGTVICLLMKEF